jgi:hypothetical protein
MDAHLYPTAGTAEQHDFNRTVGEQVRYRNGLVGSIGQVDQDGFFRSSANY